MLTKTNTSLSNLVILATLSSSVVNFSYEMESSLTPQLDTKIEHHVNIADWRDNAFNSSFDYSLHNENDEKINTIISFTKNLLENSTDIESEFVDIVNDNFWELI
ncbi:hypothetical protein [Flavobacterium agrisoli]|uniref:Uncharacterized protein n=1 Tax=Flavobacterium agrisoli TaxID=2793066 RepID=A0A934PN52_9FLAO|nr:hypothetical protein [Flavobacterium agrisoli]MBK0370567.1 hypothetical protein [Flavobacterium agrisoli]